MSSLIPHERMYRPTRGRMCAGVCRAIAEKYSLSVFAVRLLAIVSTILPGPQIVAYLILWAILPDERKLNS